MANSPAKLNARQKGKRIEREAVQLLQRCGFDARRGQQHRGGTDSPDVICDALPHIEVKGNDRIGLGTVDLDRAIEQARAESPTDTFIVLWRPTRGCWRLTFVCGFWGVPLTVAGEDRIAKVLGKMADEVSMGPSP